MVAKRDDNEILQQMVSKWQTGEGYRKERETDYEDNHGLYTNDENKTWAKTTLPVNASKRIVNRLFAVERALRSKLYPIIGDFEATPVEESDRDYANAANKWLEWFQDGKQWATMKNRLLKGNFLYNDCAIEVALDPTDNYPEGALKVHVRYPWEYVIDPIGEEWVQIMTYVPKGQLKAMYPDKADEIDAAPNAVLPNKWGAKLELNYVSRQRQRAGDSRNTSGNAPGYIEDYRVVYKLFQKSYDWETIKEDETLEAVSEEWQSILEFFYPTEEVEGTEAEMQEEPVIKFDETDDHPEHSRFLVAKQNEWLKSQEARTVNPQVLDDIRDVVELHTKKHGDVSAYMEKAGVPIGKRLKHPGGRMSVSIDHKVVLFDGNNPLGRFPLIRFSFLEDENNKFALPFASYLTPIYRLRLMVQNRHYDIMTTIVPKFKTHADSDVAKLDNDHTKPLKLADPANEGWDVASINMTTLGTADFIQLLDNDMEEITNIYAAGKGKVPTGAKSGKAIEALEAFGSTVSNLDALVYEEPLQDLGMLIWIAAVTWLPPEHFKRVIGRKATPEKLENLELSKISEVRLDISAKMRDPNLTTKEATLKYVTTVLSLPGVEDYFSPAIKAKMVTDQLELPKMDEYIEENEEYLEMVTEMSARMVAEQMAEEQMKNQSLGGGSENAEEVPPGP